MKYYLGIDIGRKGALAVINENGKLVEVRKMPLTPDEETDGRKLYDIVLELNTKYPIAHVVFEKLNSFFGLAQKAMVGVVRESGIVETVVQIAQLPYTKVAPKKWQNLIFENSKQIFKKEKGVEKLDTKAMAASKFVKVFPNYKDFDVIKNTGNFRDGEVDASLLALYAKLNNF